MADSRQNRRHTSDNRNRPWPDSIHHRKNRVQDLRNIRQQRLHKRRRLAKNFIHNRDQAFAVFLDKILDRLEEIDKCREKFLGNRNLERADSFFHILQLVVEFLGTLGTFFGESAATSFEIGKQLVYFATTTRKQFRHLQSGTAEKFLGNKRLLLGRPELRVTVGNGRNHGRIILEFREFATAKNRVEHLERILVAGTRFREVHVELLERRVHFFGRHSGMTRRRTESLVIFDRQANNARGLGNGIAHFCKFFGKIEATRNHVPGA